jgi:hypothetical protein
VLRRPRQLLQRPALRKLDAAGRRPHDVRSITKSVTGLLYGIAGKTLAAAEPGLADEFGACLAALEN